LSTSGPENQPTSTINQGDPGRCGVALRQIERDIIFELVVAPPKKCVAPPKNVSVGDYPSSMYGIIVNNRFMDIYGIILNNLIHIQICISKQTFPSTNSLKDPYPQWMIGTPKTAGAGRPTEATNSLLSVLSRFLS